MCCEQDLRCGPLRRRKRLTLATSLSVALAFGHGMMPVARADFVNFETPQVHPIDLSPDGTKLAVCNTADNRVEIFQVAAGTIYPVASIPTGLDPVSVRFRSTDEVWVVSEISASVSVISLSSRVVRATLPTLAEPADVVFAGSPQHAYVSCSVADTIRVFDPNNLSQAPVDVPAQAERPR